MQIQTVNKYSIYIHETLLECGHVSGQEDVSWYNYGSFPRFVSELWPFDCLFLLILCNFHSCTPHNSVTVRDIFMQFYTNVY